MYLKSFFRVVDTTFSTVLTVKSQVCQISETLARKSIHVFILHNSPSKSKAYSIFIIKLAEISHPYMLHIYIVISTGPFFLLFSSLFCPVLTLCCSFLQVFWSYWVQSINSVSIHFNILEYFYTLSARQCMYYLLVFPTFFTYI